MQAKSNFAKKHEFFSQARCPGCQEMYDTAIPESVNAFQKAYERLSPIAERISFQGTAMEKAD
jgi:hypothetical protein